MKDAIIAGILSGLLSPLFLSLIQQKLIWKNQKKFEIQFSVFTDAVTALSALETDCLNPRLQSETHEYKGMVRKANLRPETDDKIEKSRGMVNAFFSEDTYKLFDKALRSKITIENIPNIEFEQNRTSATVQMASELGISNNKNILDSLKKLFWPTAKRSN